MRGLLAVFPFAGLLLLEMLLRCLPPRAALALGDAFAALWFALDKRRRLRVRDNLEVARRGGLSVLRPDALVRATFGSMARVPVETFLFPRFFRRPADFLRRCRFVGDWADFHRDVTNGRGGILAGAHLGNWELAAWAVAFLRVPTRVVVRPIENRWIDRRATKARGGGRSIITKRGAVREIVRTMRSGGWVAVLADQNAGQGGVFVPFFGLEASTHAAPAALALRLRLPFYAGACLRLPGGPLRFEFRLRRCRPAATTASRAEAARALLGEHAATLEAWVRRAPDQYNWLHRRWKARPAGEADGPHLPGYARRARRSPPPLRRGRPNGRCGGHGRRRAARGAATLRLPCVRGLLVLVLWSVLGPSAEAADTYEGAKIRVRIPANFVLASGSDLGTQASLGAGHPLGGLMEGDGAFYLRGNPEDPDAVLMIVYVEAKGELADAMGSQLTLEGLEASLRSAPRAAGPGAHVDPVRRTLVGDGQQALEMTLHVAHPSVGAATMRSAFLVRDEVLYVVTLFSREAEAGADRVLWAEILSSIRFERWSVARLVMRYGLFLLAGLALLVAAILWTRGRRSRAVPAWAETATTPARGGGLSRALDGLPTYKGADGEESSPKAAPRPVIARAGATSPDAGKAPSAPAPPARAAGPAPKGAGAAPRRVLHRKPVEAPARGAASAPAKPPLGPASPRPRAPVTIPRRPAAPAASPGDALPTNVAQRSFPRSGRPSPAPSPSSPPPDPEREAETPPEKPEKGKPSKGGAGSLPIQRNRDFYG